MCSSFFSLQIVNFYKTIADHMILSQQPLMLEAARAFTRVVDEKNAVTWDDEPGLDAYVSRLQQAVERLSRENRMLMLTIDFEEFYNFGEKWLLRNKI